MKLIADGNSKAALVPDHLREVCGQVRGYDSSGDRRRAIAMLSKRGFNRFITFRDVQSRYALMVSWVSWMENSGGQVQVD